MDTLFKYFGDLNSCIFKISFVLEKENVVSSEEE